MSPRRPTDSPNWGGPRPGGGRPKLPADERTVTISASVPRALNDRIAAAAAERGVSISALLRSILERRFR